MAQMTRMTRTRERKIRENPSNLRHPCSILTDLNNYEKERVFKEY